MFLTKTFAIEDCLLYNDWNTIKSDWIKDTSVSGRNIYNYLDAFTSDVEVSFKLNNIPNNFLIGFGRLSSGVNQLKFLIFRYNSNTQVWWNNGQNNGVNISTPSTNDVVKIRTENLHKGYLYYNDNLVAYRDTNTNYPLTLRIDDFTDTPLDLDYIKVKPL